MLLRTLKQKCWQEHGHNDIIGRSLLRNKKMGGVNYTTQHTHSFRVRFCSLAL